MLRAKEYWEDRVDVRGDRQTLICGTWNAQAHSRAGLDPLHLAGKGGLLDFINPSLELTGLLKSLGKKLSWVVEKKRPDVYETLLEHCAVDADYGIFHLFMAPRGVCDVHNDRNDFLSICLGVKTPKKGYFYSYFFYLIIDQFCLGGALEIAGTRRAFNIQQGDILVMDTDQLYHGSMAYEGKENPREPGEDDRVVGIFILWKSYCRWKGIPKQDLEREKFVDHTKPDLEVLQGREKKRRKKEKRKNKKDKKKKEEKKKEKEEKEEEEEEEEEEE
jgi:hypothetical protein